MKTMRFTAIVMVALTSLFAMSVEGQQQNVLQQPFPTNLPVGNLPVIMDWAVSHYQSSTTLQYTYTNGSGKIEMPYYFTNGQFSSYQQFGQFMGSIGPILNSRSQDAATPITFTARMVYTFEGDPKQYIALQISTNLGSLANITSNSFTNITPTFVCAFVKNPGAQQIVTLVGPTNSYLYTNSWTPAGGSVPSVTNVYSIEQTTTNLIAFNSWCWSGTNRTRCRITLPNGKWMEYTQGGDPLVPGIMTIASNRLTANVPLGSDVSIQGTTDLKNWLTLTNFPWSMETRSLLFPISCNVPFRGFRYNAQ